ncbi:polyhydroxybutyrate depolymerase [Bradyrhizobium forestalis]|uniref:Polyhydroxybutyrate depolymerase n=1 Tax=Bradyrhizobium forestalis TaxID=1419263 RepID=A0A2M8R3Q3_9BRAD|nr:PHB depolymerase family esterase [Bradyrhizobium forestalis]PJG52446.1 polyhydroxybutyrate depolymerase [Bradyrhizobium forestalis]
MIRPALHVALLWLAVICCFSSARADTIDVNGVKRSYTAQLPAKRPAPLVIVLHGKTQRGADMITRTAWPQVAKREDLAVVFPDGLNNAWADARTKAGPALRGPPAGTDDIAFIAKLVEKLVADGTADAKRVFVAGVSNGGAMAMTMACARADLFVAAASLIMNLTDEAAVTCHPSRPLPMLLMNGTADPLVPYEGGRGSSYFAADGFWSTDETLAFWRRLNGCETDDAGVTDMPDRASADQSTVTRIGSRCPTGHDVVLYRINHGGHRMPGFAPDARFPKVARSLLGSQNGDIDGAETIWTFFSQFP